MSAYELDHLAIAVPAWEPAGSLLNRELGARWASGFRLDAFNPCQLAVAEDMRLELLEPGGGERSFIRRFLSENNGAAAPHHITLKVQDIHAAIAAAQAAGIEPILLRLDHPQWKEAFLHPRDAGLGFLVQMVQMVQAPQSIEDITVETFGGLACPWQEGAWLVLTQGATGQAGSPARHGFDAILAVPADEPWHPGSQPGLLPELLAAGTVHPEIGLRISSVHQQPGTPGPRLPRNN